MQETEKEARVSSYACLSFNSSQRGIDDEEDTDDRQTELGEDCLSLLLSHFVPCFYVRFCF